jgi:hypothetical protein
MDTIQFEVVFKDEDTDLEIMTINLPFMPTYVMGQLISLEQDITMGAMTQGRSNLRSFDDKVFMVTRVNHSLRKHQYYVASGGTEDLVTMVMYVYIEEE